MSSEQPPVELPVIEPDWAAPAWVRALSTTRDGGVSEGPYASLNLGAHTDDDPIAVAGNRQRLRELLPSGPWWLKQVHGEAVLELPTELPLEADAAWTRQPDVVCAVMTADCLPVLLSDRAGSCVGAVHCGWRGLQAGILGRALDHMAELNGAGAEIAWLGPAIGVAAYQVDAALAERFLAAERAPESAFLDDGPGKARCDLAAIARWQLARAGLVEVSGGEHCTAADPECFYSHRRDGGMTGRHASLIWLDGSMMRDR